MGERGTKDEVQNKKEKRFQNVWRGWKKEGGVAIDWKNLKGKIEFRSEKENYVYVCTGGGGWL